jgi:hypothetical protein
MLPHPPPPQEDRVLHIHCYENLKILVDWQLLASREGLSSVDLYSDDDEEADLTMNKPALSSERNPHANIGCKYLNSPKIYSRTDRLTDRRSISSSWTGEDRQSSRRCCANGRIFVPVARLVCMTGVHLRKQLSLEVFVLEKVSASRWCRVQKIII